MENVTKWAAADINEVPEPRAERGTSRTVLATLCALTLVALLWACAETPHTPAKRAAVTGPSATGFVVGRIKTVVNGQERTHSTGLFPTNQFDVLLWTEATGRIERRGLDGDGTFAWELPPGDYQIAGFQAYAPMRVGRIWTQFSVPGPGLGAYIGTLKIEVRESGSYRFAVEDHYDENIVALRSRSQPAAVAPTKRLMVAEPPLGSIAEIWPICSARSGLTCDRSHQGIVATGPLGTEHGYPTTAGLTPLLEWQPVSTPGVTYDVAVYEALILNPMPGFTRTLRGPLVAYGEGLTEPRYQVVSPLRADRKYEWSVRLREGTRVSTWSTTGYFDFYILWASSGSGKWFGLSTPKQ